METIKEALDKILFNKKLIENLQESNKINLNMIMSEFVKTSKEILDVEVNDKNFSIAFFNKKDIRRIKQRENNQLSNWDYINKFEDSKYFIDVKNNRLIEIGFDDKNLKVVPKIELVSVNGTHYVIELIFKSERIKNIKENIIENKFRFVYYANNHTMSCRILTEY